MPMTVIVIASASEIVTVQLSQPSDTVSHERKIRTSAHEISSRREILNTLQNKKKFPTTNAIKKPPHQFFGSRTSGKIIAGRTGSRRFCANKPVMIDVVPPICRSILRTPAFCSSMILLILLHQACPFLV